MMFLGSKRGGGASALLARASAQLKGQGGGKMDLNRTAPARFADGKDDDDDLQAYLSALDKKTKKQKSFQMEDLSDISMSSEDASMQGGTGGSGSKFLKSTAQQKQKNNASKVMKGKNTSDNSQSGSRFLKSSQKSNLAGLSTLDKVSALSSKYGVGKTGKMGKSPAQLSDSDLDISLSPDEEVMADMQGLRKKNKFQKENLSQTAPLLSKPDLGSGGGSRFLKKKPVDVDSDDDFEQKKILKQDAGSSFLSKLSKRKSFESLNKLNSDEDISEEIGHGSTENKFLKQKSKHDSEKEEDSDLEMAGGRFLKQSVRNTEPGLISDEDEFKSEDLPVSDVIDSDVAQVSEDEWKPKIAEMNFDVSDVSHIGEGTGSRFLKKKAVLTEPKTSTPSRKVPSSGKPSTGIMLQSSLKYGGGVTLDSDEEDLAQFIEGLSPDSSPTPALSSPTPAPRKKKVQNDKEKSRAKASSPVIIPQPQPSDDSVASEVVLSVAESVAESVSSEGSFRGTTLNVMELDDLELAEPEEKIPPKKVERGKKSLKQPSAKESKSKSKPGIIKNVKTLSDLENSDDNKSDMVDAAIFNKLGLQTLDDLESLGRTKSPGHRVHYESDFESEIVSKPLTTARSVASEIKTENEYESDFEEKTKATPRSYGSDFEKDTPKTTARSGYSDDFEDQSGTERSRSHRSRSRSPESRPGTRASEVTSVPETFRSDSESHRSQSSRSSRSSPDRRLSGSEKSSVRRSSLSERSSHTKTHSRRKSSASDTSHSVSEYKSRRRSSTQSSRPRPRKRGTKDVEIQTGDPPGLTHKWDPLHGGWASLGPQTGMASVDPTPVATHVVGAEALEAMTSYSPSVLALNDMLRHQLQLTRAFINTQQQVYTAYIGAMESEYKYTTLKDTKKYIRKHRKKKLTFDQALKQVKEEMGLD